MNKWYFSIGFDSKSVFSSLWKVFFPNGSYDLCYVLNVPIWVKVEGLQARIFLPGRISATRPPQGRLQALLVNRLPRVAQSKIPRHLTIQSPSPIPNLDSIPTPTADFLRLVRSLQTMWQRGWVVVWRQTAILALTASRLLGSWSFQVFQVCHVFSIF